MPDAFDETGLTTKTLTEIIEELEDDYKDIYGDDINIDQNSADGQIINIQAQEGVDLRELLSSINNGFDPDVVQEHYVLRKGVLQFVIDHCGAAVFNDKGLARELLYIGQRLDQYVGFFD